jgi:hypothetical protein
MTTKEAVNFMNHTVKETPTLIGRGRKRMIS